MIDQQEKSNIEMALSALTNGREDHYDGVNAIYRLPAYVSIPIGITKESLQREINHLLKQLSILSVQANQITIHRYIIEIDFYPRGFQMVMNKGQYVGLLIEFVEFLDNSKISGIKFSEEFYNDRPDISVRTVNNEYINFFPEFNSKCFGGIDGESIEITSLFWAEENGGIASWQ